MLEGYDWRATRQRELAAWVASIVIAPHVPKNKRPSVQQLLGQSTPKPDRKTLAEKFKALWERESQRRREVTTNGTG